MITKVNNIKENNSGHSSLIYFDENVYDLEKNRSKLENKTMLNNHSENNIRQYDTQNAIHAKFMSHIKKNQSTVNELKNIFVTLNKEENILREKIHVTNIDLETLKKDFINIMSMYNQIVKNVT